MRLTFLLAPFLLSSCSSVPMSTDATPPIASAQVMAPELLTPSPDAFNLIVKRDAGVVGSPCAAHLFLDGRKVADLGSGEKVSLYLRPGVHIVGTQLGGLCPGGSPEAEVVGAAGETRVYRIQVDVNAAIRIGPTAF